MIDPGNALPAGPFRVPFVECAAMREARATLHRLADADLPVTIAGEVGTGRRTLALAVAGLRAARVDARMTEVFGGDGLAPALRTALDRASSIMPAVVVLNRADLLAPSDQCWLADRLARMPLVLCATVAPGAALVPDLQAHLGAGRGVLPPLRERGDDAPAWCRYLLEGLAAALERDPPRLGDEVPARVRAHAWPGNLVEMARCLQRALALCAGDVLRAEDLGL